MFVVLLLALTNIFVVNCLPQVHQGKFTYGNRAKSIIQNKVSPDDDKFAKYFTQNDAFNQSSTKYKLYLHYIWRNFTV